MLNRIIVINSELYAKASILISNNASIQITAENNVGKSSFINTLNFLYITDKDQMLFEDSRKLSDSMKHYFDGTSLHSYIIFEIFKNGYYCILVKATPENSIEYYKINGEYKENFYVETTPEGFKPKKWDKVLKDLMIYDPTDPPFRLKGEELYNLIYNSDKNKNPVVWIKKEVKRKGRAYSNSFTDIYRHLIKTSAIDEKAFKNALLIADNKQHVDLNVFTSSSYEKINEFDRKKLHLRTLYAIQSDFEKLVLLNDKFVTQELILGKLKHSFYAKYGMIEKALSSHLRDDSRLSIEITRLKSKVDVTLTHERDRLIEERAKFKSALEQEEKNVRGYDQELKELEGYEPVEDNILYQGLLEKLESEERIFRERQAQITQFERSQFTQQQIESSIKIIEDQINKLKDNIHHFDSLLYQNISDSPEVIKKVYSYLNDDITKLHKSKILKKISVADLPLTIFDGKIDVSDIEIKILPTLNELHQQLDIKQKELSEKHIQLETAKNKSDLERQINKLKKSITTDKDRIRKIENKPKIESAKIESLVQIKSLGQSIIRKEEEKLNKDNEISQTKDFLTQKESEKRQYQQDLYTYNKNYQDINDKQEISEIDELLDYPFEELFPKFNKTYQDFKETRNSRLDLKEKINTKLNKDIRDIKQFISDVEVDIKGIPLLDKGISNLLDTLSYEIGNPTSTFLNQFNDFKTFVNRRFNSKLAEYPVSNIENVKVKVVDNEELIKDLNLISNLKFSDGLDFDNSYIQSKEALERQLNQSSGKPITIYDLFTIKVEITKATGETIDIDLSKQVQSRGTNIVLKLYLFLNILKDLVHSTSENKVIIYVDELDAIGQKNVKHLVRFCVDHHFVPIFAAPRKVEGIAKYYMVKEPSKKNSTHKPKITFGEMQSFPVVYTNAE